MDQWYTLVLTSYSNTWSRRSVVVKNITKLPRHTRRQTCFYLHTIDYLNEGRMALSIPYDKLEINSDDQSPIPAIHIRFSIPWTTEMNRQQSKETRKRKRKYLWNSKQNHSKHSSKSKPSRVSRAQHLNTSNNKDDIKSRNTNWLSLLLQKPHQNIPKHKTEIQV